MTRVPLLSPEDLPAEDRDVLERPINLYRVLAHTPEFARRYRALGRWIRFDSGLDPRLRELVILQVGVVTRNAYETSHHVHVGREFGLSDADIEGVIAESAGQPWDAFTDHERTLLRAARELTVDARIVADTWAALGTWMSDAERLELSAIIAFYNMTIRILEAAEVEVEDDYAGYLAEFPGIAGPTPHP